MVDDTLRPQVEILRLLSPDKQVVILLPADLELAWTAILPGRHTGIREVALSVWMGSGRPKRVSLLEEGRSRWRRLLEGIWNAHGGNRGCE